MTSEKKEGSSARKKIFWIILSIVMIGLLIWQVSSGLHRIDVANKNLEEANKEVAKAEAELAKAKANYCAYYPSSDYCN